MTAAIVGLVGVVVGAWLVGFVASSAASRRNRNVVQAAAKLLLVDVATAQSAYEQCLEEETWVVLPVTPIPLDQWQQWKALLASSVSDAAEWEKIFAVFVDAQQFNAMAAIHKDADPLSQAAKEALATALARTDEALPVLTRYAGGEHLYRHRLRRLLHR